MNSKYDPSMAKFYGGDFDEQEIIKQEAIQNFQEDYGRDKHTFEALKAVIYGIYNISPYMIEGEEVKQVASYVRKNTKEGVLKAMLRDPKTNEEVYADLEVGEKYSFDDIDVYSMQKASLLKIKTKFNYLNPQQIELHLLLMDKTAILQEIKEVMTQEQITKILYDLIYEQQEFDFMKHKEFKELFTKLANQLLTPIYAFMGSNIKLEGIGIEYGAESGTILSFVNQKLVNRNRSIYEEGVRMAVADNDKKEKIHIVFYDPRYDGHILFLADNQKYVGFADESKLPVEIQGVLSTLKMQETLDKANDLIGNRSYMFDKIITPIKETSRKQSIVSEFSDIDFDL